MNIISTLYLIFSAIILLTIAATGWRHRTVAGAREFALFSLITALYLVGYAIELTQERFEVLLFLARIENIAIAYMPVFWLLFCVAYCGYGHLLRRGQIVALSAMSTVTFLLYQTTNLHGLMYHSIDLDSSGPFPVLTFNRGIWYWVHFVYLNTSIVIGNILFVRQFRSAMPIHRRQAFTMMLASFVPWLTLIIHVSGVGPHGIDLNPFGLSVSGLLFAWGIYRQRLLDIVPVARHELVEHMHDPVLVFDDSGLLLDRNRCAGLMLDRCDEANSGTTMAEISRTNPLLGEALSRATTDSSSFYGHAESTFSIRRSRMRADGGQALNLYLFHDVTGQVRAEEELRTLNTTLEKRIVRAVAENREKELMLAQQARFTAMGEMIAAIAHQWRQPLTVAGAVMQNIQITYEEGTLDDAYLENSVATAMRQFRHMSETIEEFRSFFRPETVLEKVNIRRSVEETVTLYLHQLKASAVDVLIDGSERAPLLVRAYPGAIKQVILNLLSNARDAILERRGWQSDELRGLITIHLSSSHHTVRLEMRDNGTGIPTAARDKIFSPYFTTKGEEAGTGVGLYICRMIINSSLGGSIRLGEEHDGASFIIELPEAPP